MREDIMTRTFIPTLGRNPLYCVWIQTGDSRRPLTRVWVDPEHRTCRLHPAENEWPATAGQQAETEFAPAAGNRGANRGGTHRPALIHLKSFRAFS